MVHQPLDFLHSSTWEITEPPNQNPTACQSATVFTANLPLFLRAICQKGSSHVFVCSELDKAFYFLLQLVLTPTTHGLIICIQRTEHTSRAIYNNASDALQLHVVLAVTVDAFVEASFPNSPIFCSHGSNTSSCSCIFLHSSTFSDSSRNKSCLSDHCSGCCLL